MEDDRDDVLLLPLCFRFDSVGLRRVSLAFSLLLLLSSFSWFGWGWVLEEVDIGAAVFIVVEDDDDDDSGVDGFLVSGLGCEDEVGVVDD